MQTLEKLCVLSFVSIKPTTPLTHLRHIIKFVNSVPLCLRRRVVSNLPDYHIDNVLLHMRKLEICPQCQTSNSQTYSDVLKRLFCVNCGGVLLEQTEPDIYVERVCKMYHYKSLRVEQRTSYNVATTKM